MTDKLFAESERLEHDYGDCHEVKEHMLDVTTELSTTIAELELAQSNIREALALIERLSYATRNDSVSQNIRRILEQKA